MRPSSLTIPLSRLSFDVSSSYSHTRFEIPKTAGDILRDASIENKYEYSFEAEAGPTSPNSLTH